MATSRQSTVVAFGPPGNGGQGHRDDLRLRASFPASPLYKDEYTEETVSDIGIASLNGNNGPGDSIDNIGVKNGVINDAGHTFGTFSLNFVGAPDLADVVTGGQGLPASPYLPNPTSPGPGSVFPSDQDAFEGTLPEGGVEFGSGLGGTVSPSETSPNIAAQSIGEYLSNRSYQGSGGG